MSQSLSDADSTSRRPFERPGAQPHYTPDRPGRVEHIRLDLALDLQRQSLEGTCTIALQPLRRGLDRLTLDAVDLQIDAVWVGELSQPFEHDGRQLFVRLSQPTGTEPITISVRYRAEQPQRGIYFVAPDADYPDKPIQVWTQGEDEDSRFWFPCFDYPGQLATSEIRVRVPQPYQAISNGELIGTEPAEGATIYHWRQDQPHPSYLMALAVGDFSCIADRSDGIPLQYYIERGREADARRTLGKTPRMMAFFSELFGYPYPYPKYAQVCVSDYIFGGMENTSTTLLTDRCLLDERAAIDNRRAETLVAHELAHQWFGDLAVIGHWSHAWLKEGMASYAEVLWLERDYGRDEAAYYLLNEARNYLEEDRNRYRRPVVTNVYREVMDLFDCHLYEKGACIYHAIRTELGDEAFREALQAFVREHAHRNIETVDLRRAIERTTGRNLSFLFDRYVFGSGHPDFKVSYAWDADAQLAKLTVTQTQAQSSDRREGSGERQSCFDLRVPIAFGYAPQNGAGEAQCQRVTLRVSEPEQSFYCPLAAKPDFVSFDADQGWLKTVQLDYPRPELQAQLHWDPHPVGRIRAAEALAQQGSPEAADALAQALEQELFWGTRAEVAQQLGQIALEQAERALQAGLGDSDPRVRRAALEALGRFKTATSYEAVRQAAERGDASYYTEAAALRTLGGMVSGPLCGRVDEARQLLEQALQERSGWNEVVRAGAVGGLSQMNASPQAAETLLPYAQRGVPQPLRLAAIRGLGAVSTDQAQAQLDAILAQLEACGREPSFFVQVSAVSALKQMRVAPAIEQLRSLAQRATDARVRRLAEEGMETVQQNLGSERAVNQLRQEFEGLQRENADLKSRLAKLEAQLNERTS